MDGDSSCERIKEQTESNSRGVAAHVLCWRFSCITSKLIAGGVGGKVGGVRPGECCRKEEPAQKGMSSTIFCVLCLCICRCNFFFLRQKGRKQKCQYRISHASHLHRSFGALCGRHTSAISLARSCSLSSSSSLTVTLLNTDHSPSLKVTGTEKTMPSGRSKCPVERKVTRDSHA